MNNIIILLILLISNIYCSSENSQCLDTQIQNSRRLSGELLTQADCDMLLTSDINRFKCVVSNDGKSCYEISECLASNILNSRRLSNDINLENCLNFKTTNENTLCIPKDEKCDEVDECMATYYVYIYSQKSRRLSSEFTEEECEEYSTSNDFRLKCVPGEDYNYCESKKKTCKETFIDSENTDLFLTENDCKDLETSNDKKYKCVLSSDKYSCIEQNINASNKIKSTLAFLFLLFFF